ERRANDVVARYGGEEFALLLAGIDRPQAAQLAERLRARIAGYDFPHGEEQPGGRLTISIGVAACPSDARTDEGLIKAADESLYRAKKAGRDRVVVAGANGG